MRVTPYPFAIGLAFFLPLDLSFSCWFFFLLSKLANIIDGAAGWRMLPRFPYFDEQGSGAWTGWAVGNQLIPMPLDSKKVSIGTELKPAYTWSFCQVDKPNVLLLTLKKAEDGDGIIVRLIETEGSDVTATVMLPPITIERAYQTNLVEENERILPAQPHAVTVPIKAFGITTIRVQ